jgi:hypothetical protein
MSPIRRLPSELLRHIFMMNFDEYPCCAWILSSVCLQWRRLALSMPKLWSKVWHPLPSLLSFQVFRRGSFRGPGLASPRTFSAHFPTDPTLFCRVIALPVCQRSFPGLTVISVWGVFFFLFVGQTGGCVLHTRAPTFQKLAHWPSIAGAETVSWYRLGGLGPGHPSCFARTSVPIQ